MPPILESPAFGSGDPIPPRFTCDGADRSPPLAWSGLPEATRSLALIVDDPDAPDPAAPTTTWVHWILYNLPADTTGLGEGIPDADLPPGTRPGLNDWNRTGYGGPCPPIGRHRYYHRLYALDIELPLAELPRRDELERAMAGHIVGQAELMGTYRRPA